MHNLSNVRLPNHLWAKAHDKQELQQLIVQYMKRYPGYTVVKVKGKFAICQIPYQ